MKHSSPSLSLSDLSLQQGMMSSYERVMSSTYKEKEQKKKLVMWSCCVVSLVILLALTIGISLSTATTKNPSHDIHVVNRASAVESACKATLYPVACESALVSIASSSSSAHPKIVFDVSVRFAMERALLARSMAHNLTVSQSKSSSLSATSGIHDCLELLDITLEQLNDVLDPKKSSGPHDTKTWLSAALTNQITCSESLETVKVSSEKESMNDQVRSLAQFISNSLALHVAIPTGGSSRRRLLSSDDNLPTWLSAGDRKLLEASPEDIKADAVVAKDGSGTHKTIGEAIAYVSLAAGPGGRTVIYVKAGVYKENILIPTKQKNIFLMGDGKGISVITSNRNSEDGWTTYKSATVGAMGAGFMAKGLTIINNAGPAKHQAVALRVGADKSVVTQCSIQGYQDTLYTHSNRQFYRDNDISGTVDFIFGNSAVVIQNCFIQPLKPNGGQKNSVTAQGRTDPNQNTGISIHSCKIQCASNLGGTPTYLGRPWQKYSRVAVMESYLDGCISSAGWEQWSGSFALSTLYYGEYANTGPGASTSGRVGWAGVHRALSSTEASKFTVANFIFGDSWLPGTGVDYNAGL